LDADVIFIKNIDNVVHDDIDAIAFYKKALGGILCELQNEIFKILDEIQAGKFNPEEVSRMAEFLQNRLNISISDTFRKFTPDHQIEFIYNALNRPIRVCGMVKNEGEPGGGPF